MTSNEFYRLIEELTEADNNSITGNELLKDLDRWDSMAIVAFIAAIDEKTGVTISPMKLNEARTVNDLFRYIDTIKRDDTRK